MKSFVQTHSPSLWENLLSAITNYRAPLTTNCTDLQQKRTVALLHILAYFRYDTYFINGKQTFFLFFIICIKIIIRKLPFFSLYVAMMKLMAFSFLFQYSENKYSTKGHWTSCSVKFFVNDWCFKWSNFYILKLL